jgi:thioredoxin-related protein
MKKTLLTLTLLSSVILANELKTIETYKKAIDIAKVEGKTVIFMTSIVSCPVCDYMKDIVLQREKVINYLNENYTLVIRDIEKQSYPSRFLTTNAPTFYFVNPDGEKELRPPKIGGSTPEKFLEVIKKVIADKNNIVNL